MKVYYYNFENKATIRKVRVKPYCGAKQKQDGYLLKIYALYEHNFLYKADMFESEEDALNELKKYSCGTFKEVAE